MGVTEVSFGDVNWIHLAQGKVQWRSFYGDSDESSGSIIRKVFLAATCRLLRE
jgi:hypothetical protein